jgi:hypothetical protein
MKKLSQIVLAAALIVLPAAVQAQAQSITGSIGAQADVATVFAFGSVTQLAFGSVVPGATATATGNIIINRNVKVMYSLPDGATTGLLTLTGGTATLQPTFTSCGVGTSAASISAGWTACTPPTTYTAAPAGGQVSEYVIFNASLTTATSTLPGVYVGVIKVVATTN